MIAVICRSNLRFSRWLRESVHHHDHKKFKAIVRTNDMDGLNITSIIRIEDFWENRDHEELYDRAMYSIRTRYAK